MGFKWNLERLWTRFVYRRNLLLQSAYDIPAIGRLDLAWHSELVVGVAFGATLALAALAFDSWLSVTPAAVLGPDLAVTALALAHVDVESRRALVRDLILFGTPTAILTAVVPAVLTGMAPYANPGVLLSFRTYARWIAGVPLLGYFFGRRSRLSVVLTLAFGITGAAVGLSVAGLANDRPHTGSVLLVVALAFVEILVLLEFALWLLRLRVPTVLVEHVQRAGTELLDHVARADHLRTYPGNGLRTLPIVPCYEEQLHLSSLIQQLVEAAITLRRARQPAAVDEAIAALRDLEQKHAALAARQQLPDAWFRSRPLTAVDRPVITTVGRHTPHPPPDFVTFEPVTPRLRWAAQLVIDGLGDVLLEAVVAHDATVVDYALTALLTCALRPLSRPPSLVSDDAAVIEQAIDRCLNAIDVCARPVQPLLAPAILDRIGILMQQRSASPDRRTLQRWSAARVEHLARVTPRLLALWVSAEAPTRTAVLGALDGAWWPGLASPASAITQQALKLLGSYTPSIRSGDAGTLLDWLHQRDPDGRALHRALRTGARDEDVARGAVLWMCDAPNRYRLREGAWRAARIAASGMGRRECVEFVRLRATSERRGRWLSALQALL